MADELPDLEQIVSVDDMHVYEEYMIPRQKIEQADQKLLERREKLTLEKENLLVLMDEIETKKKNLSTKTYSMRGNWLVEQYFKPRFFEKRLYEYLGIKYFKNGLLAVVAKLGRSRKKEPCGSNYYIGSRLSRESLKKFEGRTRSNEVIHVMAGLPPIYLAIEYVSEGSYIVGLFAIALVTSTLYLAMLQRYNRARIYDVLDRRHALASKKPTH